MAGVRVSGGPLTITISLLLLTLIQVHGQQLKTFTKESYPDPRVNFAACGNSGSSWVCDPGNYLSTAQADGLNNLITGFNRNSIPKVIVAIVPKAITNSGAAATTVDQLKDFAAYLHGTAWSRYSRELTVLLVHINFLGVWVHTNSGALTANCVCQLTYESLQYQKTADYNTIIDVYVRKFIEVLSGRQACAQNNAGNVPWTVGAGGVCTWDERGRIFIASLNPSSGLPGDAATITITGNNLNQAQSALVGTQTCSITSKTGTRIICSIQGNPNALVDTPLPVYLTLDGRVNYDTGKRFIYTNPTITTVRPRTTIIGGGLNLTVEGNNLNLARTAIMRTELRGKQTGIVTPYQTSCVVMSATYMLCPTPALDLSSVRNRPIQTRKRRDVSKSIALNKEDAEIGIRRHRTARAVEDDESISVDDVDVSVEFDLNGKKVGVMETNEKPVDMDLYENPTLEPFEEEGQTRSFVSAWPVSDRTIEIKGKRLLPALKGHTVDPFVGSGRCKTGEIYTNRLICEPPIKKPEAEGEDPRVTANVGKGFDIGYLKYIDNVWDYPPMRWGIIGGAAALFVIITIIVVCCCCKKSSNNRGRQNGQYGHRHQDPRFSPQQPPHYPQHAQQGRPRHPQKRGQPRY